MKKFLIQLGVLVLLSCGSTGDEIYTIDPRNFAENKITLTELADDIEYTPLDDSLPIGLTYKLKITDANIYLSAKDIGVLKFDRSGKLVRKIGSIGRGPDQYLGFMDYTVDEKSGNVFIMGPYIIKVYSGSGRYIREIKYQNYLTYVGSDIEIFNSMIFISDCLETGDAKYSWIIFDTVGNLVDAKVNSIPPFKTNSVIEGSIYIFRNDLYYYNMYNDTIFSISPDLKDKAAYLFARGEFRWPIGKVKTDAESYKKLFKPFKMFETNHFIALVYGFQNKFGLLFIEKETKNTFLAIKYNGELSEPNLVNDLDGGMSFGRDINYYAESEKEYLVQLVNPIDLKTFVSSNSFIKGIPKNLDKKVEFQKLVNTLRETDNPVLMMARLKR